MLIALVFSACQAASSPGASISGRVFYGNTPLPSALVRIAGPTAAPPVVTDNQGAYVIGNLAGGIYSLTVTSAEWTSEGSVSLSVAVGRSAVLAPGIVLTPAGELSGQLVQSTPQDLTGAEVTLSPGGTIVFANASGAFDFGRIAVGVYSLSAVGNGLVTQTQISTTVLPGQVTQVVVPLTVQEAPPPQINLPPVVSGITMTAILQPAINPQPLIIVPDLPAGQVIPGSQFHFECQASDASGNPLTIAWQVSGGLAQASGTGIDWTASADAATIGCVVSDGQGGIASASLSLLAFDYRYIGAALTGTTVAAARTHATKGSSDLFLLDLGTQQVSQLATIANESNPQLSLSAMVYLSDENATAENPLDVYGRWPPNGAEVRLSASNGAELFSLNGNDVWIANGPTLSRTTVSTSDVILPSGGASLPSGFVINALCAGVDNVFLRQTDGTHPQWIGLRLSDLNIFLLGISAESAVAWDGTQFLVADPAADTLTTLPDVLPPVPTSAGTLPPLVNLPSPTIAGDSSGFAVTVFDSSRLFTPILFFGVSTQTLTVSLPAAVLSVSGVNVLYGTPVNTELPPTQALAIWQRTP